MTERFEIAEVLKLTGPVARVVVTSVEGSTPREAGAAMFVTPQESPLPVSEGKHAAETVMLSPRKTQSAYPGPLAEPFHETPDNAVGVSGATLTAGILGTIGGGQLEFEAIAHARAMLAAEPAPWQREMRVWPLGPSLGQCCGGAVRVLFELYTDHERAGMGDAKGVSLAVRPTDPGEALRFIAHRKDMDGLPLHVARVVKDMLSGARQRQAAFLPARKGQGACFIEPVCPAAKPLYIYGAGHVGRAIVKTIADLDFAVNWVDVAENRFPDSIPEGIVPVISSDPAVIAAAAPANAYHLVLTYSHALDLAICHALLNRPTFGFLGLIGSASKRARFLKRLREGGIAPDALERLTCPIGIGNLRGKQPATIAISVAAQLIETLEAEQINAATPKEGTSEQTRQKSA